MRRLRGKPPGDVAPLRFVPWAGFAHEFTREEIEAVAEAVGRNVIWERDETAYPHVTMRASPRLIDPPP
jgi:hypothetical protein